VSETSTCSRCAAPVSSEAIEDGSALVRDGKILCAECVDYLKESRSREKVAAGGSIESLISELRALNRNLTYERFSMWNIIGGIFQGASLFALIYSYLSYFHWNEPSNNPILWVIALQLVALSAFIMGRR